MTATIAVPKRNVMTAAEFLKLDRETLREKEGKHEFFNQKLRYMAGGSVNHGSLISNLSFSFLTDVKMKKLKSRVMTDTKIKSFLHYKDYLYPDVFVVEDLPIYEDEHKDIVVNPILIVEVLSNSTEGFDRGDKFLSYQKIDTLREYILVSQDKQQIEQWILNEKGKWQFEEVVSNGVLSLVSLPFQLDVDDVYLNIDFSQSETSPSL